MTAHAATDAELAHAEAELRAFVTHLVTEAKEDIERTFADRLATFEAHILAAVAHNHT